MQVVHKDALYPQDFEEVSGKVRIKQRPQTYSLEFTHNAEPVEDLSKCSIKNGFGIIHLDFVRRGTGAYVAVLPSDCPTPLDTVFATFHDGNYAIMEKDSRAIIAYGVVGERYVIDLIGFFNED